MPESKVRKKAAFTPPPPKKQSLKLDRANRLVLPIMLSGFLLGLAWIVTYYLSSATYPIPALHGWNMAVGTGLLIVGFGASTRWK